jgi:hypothetical protein
MNKVMNLLVRRKTGNFLNKLKVNQLLKEDLSMEIIDQVVSYKLFIICVSFKVKVKGKVVPVLN